MDNIDEILLDIANEESSVDWTKLEDTPNIAPEGSSWDKAVDYDVCSFSDSSSNSWL